MDNGCKLAWLINPKNRETIVYRQDRTKATFGFDYLMSGEGVLPGFTIQLSDIFIEED